MILRKLLKLFHIVILYDTAVASIIGYTNVTNVHSVRKRALVFPNGGTYKMIVGFTIPITIGNGRTVGFAYNLQFQYGLPPTLDSLSNLFTGVTYARKRREIEHAQDSTRKTAYKILESLLDRQGLDGEACLLKLICEEAESPLHTNNLFSELIHEILTPNYDPDTIEVMNGKYSEAQHAGSMGADCRSLYHRCPSINKLLDMITSLNIWR